MVMNMENMLFVCSLLSSANNIWKIRFFFFFYILPVCEIKTIVT